MDPFVSTIIKQAIVFGLIGGAIIFIAVFAVKMDGLHQAKLNNIYPPGPGRSAACVPGCSGAAKIHLPGRPA